MAPFRQEYTGMEPALPPGRARRFLLNQAFWAIGYNLFAGRCPSGRWPVPRAAGASTFDKSRRGGHPDGQTADRHLTLSV